MTGAISVYIELLDALLNASAERCDGQPEVILREFVEGFFRMSEPVKEQLRNMLPPDEMRKIVGVSACAAERAMNDRDQAFLFSALAIQDLEEFRNDPRDNMPYLAMVHYAAQELGVNADQFFLETAAKMSPRTCRYLSEFVSRPPKMKTLAVMGVQTHVTPDGVRFLR